MTQNTVTAGIILIGDELLSGRTQDTNLGTIAKWLEPLGVQVGEARIVADHAKTISKTVRVFSERFDYVSRYEENELNEARRRMARIPDGASLIKNPVSQAPGFQTKNVFTMAGVPSIMRGMLPDIEHRIKGGAKVYSRTVEAVGIGEGDAAAPLAEIEKTYAGVSIGSYPFFNAKLRGVNFVARGRDETVLNEVEVKLKDLVTELSI